jgi:hypothetical protein
MRKHGKGEMREVEEGGKAGSGKADSSYQLQKRGFDDLPQEESLFHKRQPHDTGLFWTFPPELPPPRLSGIPKLVRNIFRVC